MTECAPNRRLFLFLFLISFVAGCSQMRRGSVDEEKEPQFMEGQKRVKRMDWDGAIQSFERALQANPSNASAHFELGVLYDQKKTDYAAAIYHYQRHLLLRTNSPMADLVKQNITACTRELAKSVQYAVVTREVQRDLERLAQTNTLLKTRVEFLEAELLRRPQYITNYITNFVGVPLEPRSSSRLTQPTQLVSPPTSSERTGAEPSNRTESPQMAAKQSSSKPSSARRSTPLPERRTPEPAAAQSTGTRTVHTVRPGETLASLASRYGVSLQALKAANPAAAGGVRSGQKINIPK
jgi:LysM repeat protein